jgi:predicted DNA-binding protein
MLKCNTRKQLSEDQPVEQGALAMRLYPAINARFQRVVKFSKRSKTSIVLECLEKVLPEMEKQYLPKT